MNNQIDWLLKPFDELTSAELYDFLHLRCKTFIMEQNAPYLDTDYKDQKALHLMGRMGGKLVAYCRLFRKGDYFENASIGRVIVDADYRKFGYGHQLMDTAMELMTSLLKESNVTISAQAYLQHFYEEHGFAKVGEAYLEDGIPHIRMEIRTR